MILQVTYPPETIPIRSGALIAIPSLDIRDASIVSSYRSTVKLFRGIGS